MSKSGNEAVSKQKYLYNIWDMVRIDAGEPVRITGIRICDNSYEYEYVVPNGAKDNKYTFVEEPIIIPLARHSEDKAGKYLGKIVIFQYRDFFGTGSRREPSDQGVPLRKYDGKQARVVGVSIRDEEMVSPKKGRFYKQTLYFSLHFLHEEKVFDKNCVFGEFDLAPVAREPGAESLTDPVF